MAMRIGTNTAANPAAWATHRLVAAVASKVLYRRNVGRLQIDLTEDIRVTSLIPESVTQCSTERLDAVGPVATVVVDFVEHNALAICCPPQGRRDLGDRAAGAHDTHDLAQAVEFDDDQRPSIVLPVTHSCETGAVGRPRRTAGARCASSPLEVRPVGMHRPDGIG